MAKSWATVYSVDFGSAQFNEDEWLPIFKEVQTLSRDAEALWLFVLEVFHIELSKQALEMLAVGPLEDLVQDHGRLVIDRIELEARRDKEFAALLSKVWVSNSDDPVTQRFIRLGCQPVAVAK